MVIAVPFKIKYTHRMKNKDHEIINSHNIRLARIDSQKVFVDKMIKDLQKQYHTLCDDWEETWRSKQHYINEHGLLTRKKLEASK